MGLDMYLEKYPIVTGTVNGVAQALTPNNFNAVDSWLEYQEYLKKPLREDEKEKCTFEEWSLWSNELPNDETVNKLLAYSQVNYYEWDKDHNYPHISISKEVGYWRKANAIHNWFVTNVQDGEDDCEYHHPVTAFELMNLRSACEQVLESLNLVDGKICNGYTYKDGEKICNYEDGKVAINTALAEKLLPTQAGFFFGSTDYDEYYAEDLKYTIELCTKLMNETDFTNEVIYYRSSW